MGRRLAVAAVFLVTGGGVGQVSPRFIGVLIDTAADGGAEAIGRTANRFEAGEVFAKGFAGRHFGTAGRTRVGYRLVSIEITSLEGD